MVLASGVAGATVHGVGLTGAEPADGYLPCADLSAVQEHVRARRSDDGAHRLRVVDHAAALAGPSVRELLSEVALSLIVRSVPASLH